MDQYLTPTYRLERAALPRGVRTVARVSTSSAISYRFAVTSQGSAGPVADFAGCCRYSQKARSFSDPSSGDDRAIIDQECVEGHDTRYLAYKIIPL